MATAVEKWQAIIEKANASLKDAFDFDKGNKSAGTRLRKAAMEVRNAAQDVRQFVSEVKNAE